jgi:hypothetical protein
MARAEWWGRSSSVFGHRVALGRNLLHHHFGNERKRNVAIVAELTGISLKPQQLSHAKLKGKGLAARNGQMVVDEKTETSQPSLYCGVL